MKLNKSALPARFSAVFLVVVAMIAGVAVSPAMAAGPPVFSAPTVSFTWPVDVPITDSVRATGAASYAGETASQEVSTTDLAATAPEWVSTRLPYLWIGELASGQLVATGATRFTVVAGALPLGVTLDPVTGVLAGAPTAIEHYEATIRASGSGWDVDQVFTGYVFSGFPVWVTEALPEFRAGVRVDFQLEAIGAGRFIYQSLPLLPAGLSLSGAGLITGVPTTAGSYSTTLWAGTTIVNSTGTIQPKQFSGTVLKRPPVWSGSLGSFRVGDPLRRALPVTGAASYSIASGALPAGVTLNLTTGFFEGTPTTAGAYSVEIVAHTDDGGSSSLAFSGNVVVAVPSWNLSKFPPLRVGSPVPATQLTTSADRLVQVNGTLPPGLTLSATGELSGTPTAAGRYSVTLSAANDGGSASALFTGDVADLFRAKIEPGFAAGDRAEGAEFDILVTGADAGSPYVATLHSTPIIVGDGVVPAAGAVTQRLTLPAVPQGAHTIALTAVLEGLTVTNNLWFSVDHAGAIVEISTTGPVAEPQDPVGPAAVPSQGSGTLALLGADILPTGILAIALLSVGIVLRRGNRRVQVKRRI